MEALSDYDLVRKTIEGYSEAFAVLVGRYQKPLIKLSMRYVGDVYSAEDIVQESFLKAFEKMSSFQFRSAFKSWMYRIAINTAKNKLRSKKFTVDIDKVVLKIPPKSEVNVITNQLKEQMRLLVDQLPDRQRRALELRIYDDLSFKEVALDMDCPYDTAKANYRHGLMKIRNEMNKEGA